MVNVALPHRPKRSYSHDTRPMHRNSALALLSLSMTAGVASMLAAASEGAPAGDAAAGRKLFNRTCRVCHQVEADAGSATGPNLAGVLGRVAGADAGFGYSAAFDAAASRGVRWDAATLEDFLAAPARVIPGGKMPMAVADPTQRRDLIAYLSTLQP
jgi:cytochrome c